MKVRFAALIATVATTTSSSATHPRRIRKAPSHHPSATRRHPSPTHLLTPTQQYHRNLLQTTTNPTELPLQPSDYNDEWWDDLPLHIQQAYTVLGWDQYSWNTGSVYPSSESLSWEELTPEMQSAASVIGYTSDSWDNDSTEEEGMEYYAWSSLPSYIQNAAIILGWDENLWDTDGAYAWSDRVYWRDLTTKQKKAAIVLGYDEVRWDESVEALLLKDEEDAAVIAVVGVDTVEEVTVTNKELSANEVVVAEMSLPVLEKSMSALYLQLEISIEAENEEMSMTEAATEETSLSVHEISLSAPTDSKLETNEMQIDEVDTELSLLDELELSMLNPLELESVLTTETPSLDFSVGDMEILEMSISMPESSMSITVDDEHIEQSMSMTEASMSFATDDNESETGEALLDVIIDDAINIVTTDDAQDFEADSARKEDASG